MLRRPHPRNRAEMKRIFNGKDLAGWDGDPRLWSVKEGAFRGETTAENPAKGNTFLIWKEGVTKDFELRLSFRCNATNNSGIQYRSKHITEGKVRTHGSSAAISTRSATRTSCPASPDSSTTRAASEAACASSARRPLGERTARSRSSATLIDQQQFQKLFKLDDWNDVVIIAKGPHIQHYLNNRLILDCTDNDPQLALREGILALQLHAGKPMWAEFKNVRIREIK